MVGGAVTVVLAVQLSRAGPQNTQREEITAHQISWVWRR